MGTGACVALSRAERDGVVTSAEWQRVRELFGEAVELPSSAARALVHAHAASDPDVAAEALSLLENHSRAGAFLTRPIADRVTELFDEDTRFEPGAVFGSYQVIRELGRGGMGRVYLATDTRLKRTVALKVLLPSRTRDPAQRERLRREAQAAAGLTHPGICTVYALEELHDDVFIVAEYVDGHSLRDEIKSGQRPSIVTLTDSARQLAEALASAHAKGITHRDLKPENVMRTTDGRLKILDFGLALIERAPADGDALPRITVSGAVLGTPGYMAPEQLKSGTIDARTDIFAFGVLMYEYASGLHPFDGATDIDRIARVLETEPRPLRDLRSNVPESLAITIGRCLRKLPGERFASMIEVAAALTAAPVHAASSQVTVWWRNHQLIALASYFVASGLAWQIKEWQHGFADGAFVGVAILSTIGGFFRGHLLFTERMNPPAFDAERLRARPITLTADLLVAGLLAGEGWQLTSLRPLAGTLTLALSIGLALTRLVIEPTTTRAAFDRT
jgi:predicted Ser/Thr protein kinase